MFGLFLEEAYLGRIVAPGPRDQIMEIVTNAKQFKNVLVSVRFAT